MRNERQWRLATIALLTATLLTGCGGASGDAGDASGSSAADAEAVRFAACMRAHGVPDFPDPVDGRITLRGAPTDSAAMQAAQEACRKLAPQGRADAQMQEQLLAFCQCMRAHGVPDFPDPEGPGRLRVPRTIDTQSPQFEQARQACQEKLRGSGWGDSGVGG